jgi:hypothetical protein
MKCCTFNKTHIHFIRPVESAELPNVARISKSLETPGLDNRITDGGQIVRLTRRPPFTPRKIPGTHFCYRLSGS